MTSPDATSPPLTPPGAATSAGPLTRVQKSGAEGLWRLARTYGWRYRWLVAAVSVLMLAEGALTAALAYLLDPAIKYLFMDKNPDLLLIVPAGIMLVVCIKAACGYGNGVLLNHVGQRMIGDVQTDMFDRVIRFDLADLNAMHSGQFASSFLNDAAMMRETINRSIQGLARDLVTLLGLGAVMYYQDWKLALAATTVLPFIAFQTLSLGKRTHKAAHQSMAVTGDLATHIAESLDGRRVIKAYGLEAETAKRANAIIDLRFKYLMRGARAKAAATPSAEALAGVGIAAVVGYAGYQAIYGTMGLNNFVSFLGAMMLAYQSIRSLSHFFTALAEGQAAANRTFAFLDLEPRIRDANDAKGLELSDGRAPAIRFSEVAFTYGDRAPALSSVSFEAPAGKTTALVGPSGAGKSTILNLLLRFYEANSGAITIEGQDIRTLTIASLREAMGLVTQEPFLFDDTIRANIAAGDRAASDAAIQAAARAAQADSFILASSQGYETVVGEGGLRLSGGQRQRIAIARAMLKNAPILLLDEATSALDSESERDVQAALKALMRGRTTLVIAHRLSTIMDADRIVVLDQGRVVEQGTHNELILRGGLYSRLYRTQAAEAPGPAISAGAMPVPGAVSG